MKVIQFNGRAHDMERRALSWVVERLHYFDPLGYREVLKLDLAIKASAELALVCECALSRRTQYSPKEYREIASHIWSDVFCARAVRDYLLTTELGLLTFGFYASLRQCGYQDGKFEDRLQEVLEEGYVSAAERIPTRDLDLIHSLKRLGLPWNGEPSERVYARSLLAKHPSLYPLTIDDTYAITHAVFFLTDFGRADGCFSAADFAYLATMLPRLLQYYLRKGNWDLVAELLICLQATGLDHVPLYSEGWGLLLSSQENDGSFPGPKGDQDSRLWADAKRTDDNDSGWHRFHDNYHTTLVTLLASQALLRVADSQNG